MRRAYLTTEFWLCVAFMCAAFTFAIYAVKQQSDLMGVAAVITAISTAPTAQIFGRNRVKEKRGEA